MQDHLNSPLNRLPPEDLLELYLDTMRQFIELRQKPYAVEAKEKLKEELKTKLKQLYKNIGVDFDKEIKNLTKEII